MIKKRDDLCSLIDTVDADIVLLTETWLSAKISNHELFNCEKAFSVYRADRGQRIGGGVLLAVSENIPSFVLDISSPLEMIWVAIELHLKKMVIGVCYHPPAHLSITYTML